MIESLLVDEMRERLAEDIARSQFKTPPEPASERVGQILQRVGRPVRGGRRRGMSAEQARRIQSDAAAYDAAVARGEQP